MAVKQYKSVTPSRRYITSSDFREVTKRRPEKSLLAPWRRTGGKDAQGHISARHRGGGHKRRYRMVDFKRDKDGVPAKVAAIEYDPNRSCHLALLQYRDGEKRYILAPLDLKVGDVVMSGESADVRRGNAMPLRIIPLGSMIHNIELTPGKGGQICRSAGSVGQLMAKEGKLAQIRLPSGEFRSVYLGCRATIGQLGNVDHENVTLGKAGRSRWLGRRPHTRGLAMDPSSHPHGGGEGKSPIGRKSPVSRWGKPTLGYRTRKKKASDRMIIKRRK